MNNFLDKFLATAPTLIVGGAAIYAGYVGQTVISLLLWTFLFILGLHDKLNDISDKLNKLEKK